MAKDNKTADATFQSGFNLRDYLAACASKWIWFLVSIIVICGFAYYKVIRKMPVYLRTEQVLIKDEDQGNSIDNMASSFSGFGLGRMRSNVQNETTSCPPPRRIAVPVVATLSVSVPRPGRGRLRQLPNDRQSRRLRLA